MNRETREAFERLCRRHTLTVVHRVSDPDKEIQTNTAEALIRRNLAYTYQTQTRGRSRILADTKQAAEDWAMNKLMGTAAKELEALEASLNQLGRS